jgi:hypothetical protein
MSVTQGARPLAVTPHPLSPSRRLLRGALGATIVVGSLVTWLGIPLFWIWVAAQFSDEHPLVYMIALAACPATMAAWGFMLYRLNATYVRLGPPEARTPPAARSAWLKSVSGERGRRRPTSLIDVSMALSVIIAVVAMAVWFFAFAENYVPFPR